jgi:tetratricopeptide (TPR) repeat protein
MAETVMLFLLRRWLPIALLASVMAFLISSSSGLAEEDSTPRPLARAVELHKARKFDQALKSVDEFIATNPKHAEFGNSHLLRGKILLEAGRTRMSRVSAVNGNESKQAVRKKARTEFESAHASLLIARKLLLAKQMVFFHEKLSKERQLEIRKFAVRSIRCQLDVALALYETAGTYESVKDEFSTTMRAASKEFEKIHSSYRSQIGGLYARMWQGRCFHQLGEVQKALGIYNELLGHHGASKSRASAHSG